MVPVSERDEMSKRDTYTVIITVTADERPDPEDFLLHPLAEQDINAAIVSVEVEW